MTLSRYSLKSTPRRPARRQFPRQQPRFRKRNALNHSESKTFDARFGGVASLTGPNGLTTTWQYDSFGRKTEESRADGGKTVWTYEACDAACPANGVYRLFTQVYGGGIQSAPTSVAYFDRLNREVRAATQSLDASWIYQDTVYDGQGRAQQVSRPYFIDQPEGKMGSDTIIYPAYDYK